MYTHIYIYAEFKIKFKHARYCVQTTFLLKVFKVIFDVTFSCRRVYSSVRVTLDIFYAKTFYTFADIRHICVSVTKRRTRVDSD